MYLVKRIVALILVVLMCFSMASCSFFRKENDEVGISKMVSYAKIIDIKATEMADDLITTQSGFCVSAEGKTTEEELRNTLVFNPDFEYSVEKKSGNTFIVTPDNELEDSSLVRIKAMDSSKVANEWAFQTDGSLRVLSHTPNGYASYDDGVEVKLSSYDVINFEECFSISPKIDGRFTKNGKTYIFIPNEYEMDEKYTVTISKDLKDLSGHTLGKDYTFSFKVSDESRGVSVEYNDCNLNDSFRTNEIPKANICLFNFEEKEYNISASTYLIDTETYKSLIPDNYWGRHDVPDMSDKTPFQTFKPTFRDNYGNYKIVDYPSTLSEGKYVTIFEDESGEKEYHLFQVSDYVVYMLSTDNNLTVWVNDAKSGQPAYDCEVTFAGNTVKTDKDGIAEISYTNLKNIERETNDLVYIGSGENSFITKIGAYASNKNKYYTYMYASSTLYRPGDTVNLWGFVVPSNGGEMPKEVELVYDYCSKTAMVTLDKNGSFTFSFVTDAPSGSRYIDNYLMIDGEDNYGWCTFNVSEYDLPEMTIEVNTDKKALYYGDSFNIDIKAKSFNGTPIANSEFCIDISNNEDHISKKLTSDSKGEIHYTFNTKSIKLDDPDLHEYLYISVAPADGYSSENCKTETGVALYFSNIGIYEDYESDEKNTVYICNIDIDKMNDPKGDYYYYDAYGSPASITCRMKVTEEYRVQVKTGEYYDFLTHKFVDEFEYENVSKVRFNKEVTLDEKITLDYNKYAEKDGDLKVEFICDTIGVECAQSIWLDNPSDYYVKSDKNVYPEIRTDKESYNVGDTVNVTAENVGDVDRAVFICSFIDKQKVIVTSGASASFTFDDDYKNGTIIYAAFYDGEKITGKACKVIESDYDFNALVSVKSEKDEYKPGDIVKLSILTTDSAGNPISAVVNVNVVDSALLKASPNPVGISNIYPQIEYNYYDDYSSSWQEYNGLDEGGGGGDGATTIRMDFEDTPFFGCVETDSSGKAQVEFKLPDSVTTWDVTATAICQDGKSGYVKSEVRGTIDFFMITSGTNVFCDKDDIVTAVKCLSDTASESEILTTATLMSVDGKVVNTINSKHSFDEYCEFNFGKLSEGTYKIKYDSECGDNSDSIMKEIEVKKTKVMSYITDSKEIANGTKLDVSTNYVTTVKLIDSSYSEYMAIYNEAMSLKGDYFDVNLAREYMTAWKNNNEFLPSHYHSISHLTWSDQADMDTIYDYELMAKYAILFPGYIECSDDFNEAGLSGLERLYKYAIQGSNGMPVLKSLSAYKNIFNQLTDEEKVWVALAYVAAGDLNSARDIYSKLGSALMLNSKNEIKKKYEDYEKEQMTNLLAFLSFCINSDDVKERLESILQIENKRVQPAFELIAYVERYYSGQSTLNEVEIDVNGEKQNISFYGTDSYFVTIYPEDIANTKFTSIKGNVTAVYSYYSYLNDIKPTGSGNFKVETSVSKDTVSRGKTFYLYYDITSEYSNSVISLDLVIPAGVQIVDFEEMKIDGNSEKHSYLGYGTMLPDNRTCHIKMFGSSNYRVSIKCIASFSGDFTFESAVGTNLSYNSVALSNECNITIK